jgi:cytochrome c-type biogenesis protein CcmI
VILVIVAAILLTLAALAFIALPLVRPSRAQMPRRDSASADLLSRRDRIYGELRELEFDARVGKVTGSDYADARERLESDAARVLRALDAEGYSEEADEVVASQVLAVELVAPSSVCRSCGVPLADGARFCSSCGEPAIVEARP